MNSSYHVALPYHVAQAYREALPYLVTFPHHVALPYRVALLPYHVSLAYRVALPYRVAGQGGRAAESRERAHVACPASPPCCPHQFSFPEQNCKKYISLVISAIKTPVMMNFNLLIVRDPVIFSNLVGADQGGEGGLEAGSDLSQGPGSTQPTQQFSSPVIHGLGFNSSSWP